MIDHLIRIVVLLLVCIGTGFFVDLWSFVIGDPYDGEVKQGRILSRFGAYLLRKFNEKAEQIAKLSQSALVAHVADAQARWRLNHPGKEFPLDHPAMAYKPTEPINWWKAAGVCPRCLLVWVATAAFLVAWLVLNVNGWWWMGYMPFLGIASASLSVSARLRE